MLCCAYDPDELHQHLGLLCVGEDVRKRRPVDYERERVVLRVHEAAEVAPVRRRTVPGGILCRAGYYAARDTMPCRVGYLRFLTTRITAAFESPLIRINGIASVTNAHCRVGYRAGWGYRAARDTVPADGIPCRLRCRAGAGDNL